MDKVYFIFAGVNGVGKTTLYNANRNTNLGVRINNDEILREFGGDWKNQNDQAKALLESLRLIQNCIENGLSFNHETVFTGDSYGFVKRIKNSGYKIYLHFVGVDNVEIAINRVNERVKKGGHGIEESDIRRRYKESLKNLKKVMPLCDRIYLYDNTECFKRVVEGKGGEITDIYNSCKWLIL